jgi:AbrB family looped-hinge helix DNA binding protein
MTIITLSSKGQITLPAETRRRMGLKAKDRLLVREEDGRIIITKPLDFFSLRGIAGKAKSLEEEREGMIQEILKRTMPRKSG